MFVLLYPMFLDVPPPGSSHGASRYLNVKQICHIIFDSSQSDSIHNKEQSGETMELQRITL